MILCIPVPAARLAAGAMLGWALAGTATAQSVPARLPLDTASVSPGSPATLAQATEAAWRRASQSREVDSQARRAEAQRTAAASLWPTPPALELSHRSDRWQTDAGRKETEAAVSWPLWLPGQQRAQAAVADADGALAQAAAPAGRLHLAGRVREAAWALHGQRLETELAQAQLRHLQALADDVDRRVRAGDLAPADALAARSEVLAAESALGVARQRQAEAVATWKLLTGLDDIPTLDPGHPPAAPAQIAPDQHPDAQLAALVVERARRRLDLLETTRRDPAELRVSIRQDLPGRGDSAQNSLGLGIRIPLGTAGRNEPLRAAALGDLDVAETAQQRTLERLAAEAATAHLAVRAAAQQMDGEDRRAALLHERAALVERSFKAGETPLPDLLRALSAAAQADISRARHRAAWGLAQARLQQASGILP
ncbi:TolC family protein [Paracidovorax sp. MALMAid1276]|uniref:TolC family protein n=1 Tax=Paracidovorax sp. MALMAid1276 TaxID=3411631 RepID=UPI003B99B3E5